MNLIPRRLERYFVLLLKPLIHLVDCFIPKNKNWVVFGSSAGASFGGNSEAFYQFLKDNSDYKCFYVSSTKSDRSRNILNYNKWKDLVIILQARVYVGTHGPMDFFGPYYQLFYNSSRIFVQFWHGIPIKRMALLDNGVSKSRLKDALNSTSKDRFFLVGSETEAIMFQRMLNLPSNNIAICGFPRNDKLFRNSSFKNECLKKSPSFNKAILYAPTWREDNVSVKFFPFCADLKKLEDLLESQKIVVFIRGHINTSTGDNGDITALKRVVEFNSDIEPDISNVLNCFDAVITDYSSIYLDFLLLDRPIGFIPYDLENYIEKRGLLYEYKGITPGHQILDFDAFTSFVADLCSEGKEFEKERKVCRDLFHRYQDGLSNKRVFNKLKKWNIL
jgi:CDP-glycerol glycerophosphotransferase